MSYPIAADERGTPTAMCKPAARGSGAEAREIDRLPEQVRVRGDALSAQIEDLLKRIG